MCAPFEPDKHPDYQQRWKTFSSLVLLGHEKLLQGHSSWYTLNLLLQMAVDEIGAEFGYFGRYMWKEGEPDTPVMKALSYTNIAWTPELQALVQTVNELEFPLLGGGLFADPFRNGKVIIADPAEDHSSYKGMPEGHPPLKNFIGVPLFLGPNLVGQVGFANRAQGWTEDDGRFLETWGSMLGALIVQFDDYLIGTKGQPEEVARSEDGIIIFDERLCIHFCNVGASTMLKFNDAKELVSCYPTFDQLLEGGLSRNASLNHFDLDQTLRMSSLLSTGVRFEAELKKAPTEAGTDLVPVDHCEVDLIITSFEYQGCINYTAIIAGSQIQAESQPSELTEDIYRAANILYSVVNDTIDIVRIHAQKFVPELVTFSVLEVLRLSERIYCASSLPGVEVKSPEVSPGVPSSVLADERRFVQVLGNLLSNATKHTSQGHILVRVEALPCTEIQRRAGYAGRLQVFVEDTGSGIAVADQPKLFQFFTNINRKKDTTTSTSGLGLLLSRDIAHALGGDVWLERSTPQKGSVFGFCVPYRLDSEEGTGCGAHVAVQTRSLSHSDRLSEPPASKGCLSPLHGVRVLVVDDNVLISKIATKILEGSLCVCETAENGQEALELLLGPNAHTYDVVLMDCLMPKMDGYTAVSKLRDAGYRGPVLAITGNTAKAETDRALEMAVDEIGAEFGYFGRYMWKEGEPDTPVMKALSYTNIAWTPELQALVQTVNELEFPLLGGGLFADPFRNGKVIIADPAEDHSSYKGMPEGHPPLKNFIGVPIFLGPNLVGQVGFANRAQGWTEDDGRFLETWGSMLGALIVQFDDYLIGTKGQPEEVARSEDGIIIFDERLCIHFCNVGASTMLKFNDAKELVSCYPTFDQLLEGGLSRNASLNHFDLDQTLRMSSLLSTGVRFEAELKKAPTEAGTDLVPVDHCEVDLIITSFEYQGCINYTALFRDIGQEKIFRRKDTLLAFLSHEIRNPLQAIIAGSQIQAESQPSELTEDIYRAANILYSVVNDTIDIVRIHAQKFVPELVTFSVLEVLRLSERIYCASSLPGVEVKSPEVSPGVPSSVLADERRFVQVLGNLLSNATKHTSQGHILVRVEALPCTEIQRRAGYAGRLQVFVEDTGSGIAVADQPKLFQFFTNINRKKDTTTSTSGLGLLLSRDIARALGGDVWLERSTPQKGSVFGFCVPYRLDSEEGTGCGAHVAVQTRSLSHSDRLSEPPASKGGLSPLHGVRVLVVDDNVLISKIATKILEGSLCVCETAENGQEALELLLGPNAHTYDVVLMDCLMPKMDGYTAVSKLRDAGYRGPVLAITGNTAKAETDRALEMAVDEIGAEFGYFGRYMWKEGEPDTPVMKALSYTNIAWTPELQALVQTVNELEFPLLGGGLFADPFRNGKVIIADPAEDHSSYKGMPEGHPPLKNFIGVPIFLGPNLVGQVGFANRAQGWTEDDGRFLETWGSMLGALIVQFDDYLRGTKQSSDESAKSEATNKSIPKDRLEQQGKGALSEPCGHVEEESRITDDTISSDVIVDSGLRPVATGVRFEAELKKAPTEAGTDLVPVDHCEVDLIITSFEYQGCINYTALFRDIGQEKIFRRKDTLLAFLSHEIRNPLQAIIAGSQIQAESQPSELTEDIYRAANILYSVVNDTIDIVRIHAQKFVPELVTFSVLEVLRLSERIYCASSLPGVEVKSPEVSPGVPSSVLADERRFVQVLGNLLSNATKHTSQGHILVRVEALPCTEIQRRAGYAGRLQVFVEDTGSGIAVADQPKLFQFFTNINRKKDTTTSTSGLGLLLSRDIARALGGDVWLERSTPQKGSVFGFCVPYRLDSEEGAGCGAHVAVQTRSLSHSDRLSEPPASKGGLSPLHGVRVLVVDDNVLISKIATKILEGSLCVCETAENGQEALELLLGPDAHTYDVVLMDCLMPKMDGYTAVSKLRDAGYRGPVLAITGNTAKAETDRALEVGYTDVLLKPVKNQDLLDKVRHWHEHSSET
eukprot:jgi/Pico_ML_1/51218/g2291.t2